MDIEKHYRNIAPKLTNYLVASGTDYALACDIVQETFLRIWKNRDNVIDEENQISGLAYTIAKNIRTDRARKASREVLQGDIMDGDDAGGGGASVPASNENVSNSVDRAYLRKRIIQALNQIPPLLREAYILFQIQELPISEIARRTNVNEALVKVRVFRAKEKLQPLLKDLL